MTVNLCTETLTARYSTTGLLCVDILHARIWLWDGNKKQQQYAGCLLVIGIK
ncbi:hypothetical protein JW960_25830 [candidate division KSB1 bacterium]|nr:hypothetical protein [candidate division KSB1 bacterium]